jgi:hypothetical protein
MLNRFAAIAALALAMSLATAGCGNGGGQSAPQNNATYAPPASPMTAVQKEIASLPMSELVPVPKGLKCKHDMVVWVNKKTYHESGDPYYGRTKHGEYMCKAAADAAGDHLAGTRHMNM